MNFKIRNKSIVIKLFIFITQKHIFWCSINALEKRLQVPFETDKMFVPL